MRHRHVTPRSTIVLLGCMAASLLLASCASEAPTRIGATPTQRDSLAAPHTGHTAAGHRFVVPEGWSLTRRSGSVILQAPEGGSWIALVDTDAADATGAITQAWQRYAGRAPPALLMALPLANQNGWRDGHNHIYQVPTGEPRQWMARAMRADRGGFVVLIDDLARSAAATRAADLRQIRDGFLPAGHVRETFAGRRAHLLDAGKIEELKAFVGRSRQLLEVPGVSVGILQGGRVIFAGGFGVREHGRTEPVDARTRYLIASNTKPLTSLMLARLVEEGLFSWATPVIDLLPEFKLADAALTPKVQLRHLACACAGLPYRNLDWEFARPDAPATVAFDILARMRPTSAFGSSYQYSNPPAAASGFVGAHAAYPDLAPGAAYDQAMATRVFQPLGMQRTTFDNDLAMRGNFARSHGVGIDGAIEQVDPRRDRQMHAMRPTGGAWSTVEDLLKYVRLELRGGLLEDGRRQITQAALEERWKPQVSTGPYSWYGLGLDTDISRGTPMRFHGGRLYGQRSNIVWWPEHDVGMVILMNSSTGNVLMDAAPRKLMELLFDGQPEADSMVAAAAEGERIRRQAWRRDLQFPPASGPISALASQYRNDQLGELRVERSGDQARFHFAPWDAPVASRLAADGAVEFVLAIPSPPPPFLVGESPQGLRTLTLRDAQNTYVFTEVSQAQ